MKTACLTPFIDVFVTLAASTAMLLAVLNPETSAYQRKVQFQNEKQQKGKSRQLFNEKFTRVEISRDGRIKLEGKSVASVKGLKNSLKNMHSDGVSVESEKDASCGVVFEVLEMVQSMGLKKMEFSLR